MVNEQDKQSLERMEMQLSGCQSKLVDVQQKRFREKQHKRAYFIMLKRMLVITWVGINVTRKHFRNFFAVVVQMTSMLMQFKARLLSHTNVTCQGEDELELLTRSRRAMKSWPFGTDNNKGSWKDMAPLLEAELSLLQEKLLGLLTDFETVKDTADALRERTVELTNKYNDRESAVNKALGEVQNYQDTIQQKEDMCVQLRNRCHKLENEGKARNSELEGKAEERRRKKKEARIMGKNLWAESIQLRRRVTSLADHISTQLLKKDQVEADLVVLYRHRSALHAQVEQLEEIMKMTVSLSTAEHSKAIHKKLHELKQEFSLPAPRHLKRGYCSDDKKTEGLVKHEAFHGISIHRTNIEPLPIEHYSEVLELVEPSSSPHSSTHLTVRDKASPPPVPPRRQARSPRVRTGDTVHLNHFGERHAVAVDLLRAELGANQNLKSPKSPRKLMAQTLPNLHPHTHR